jgi:hypothetical protein
MKKRIWMIPCVLGLLSWSFGTGVAPAAVISPVEPGSNITLSILQDGRDVTDSWLPELGRSVEIVVNGMASPTLRLAAPTSAHPGQCTNFGSEIGLDFTLTASILTSADCGGTAVIMVSDGTSTATFILPKDTDADGMPDIWEDQYCPLSDPQLTNVTCLTKDADGDAGPVSTSPIGDGIANFDEYRGFLISGIHHRTDPRQKDVFVHLVNPQCGTDSLLGGGAITFPSDGLPLFGNVNTLISGTQVHVLGYLQGTNHSTTGEWVDRFVSYNEDTRKFTYDNAATSPPPDDRQINKNALFRIVDIFTGSTIQKGLRVTECLAPEMNDPANPVLGSAGWGSANGPDNALLYTSRIAGEIDRLIDLGGARPLKLSPCDGSAPRSTTREELISMTIRYLLAMEIGHAVRLTPTTEETRRVSYNYHHAPGTCSNLDFQLVNTLSSKETGSTAANTFYIPQVYNQNDQGSFRIRN